MTATRRSRSYEVSPRGRRAGFRSPRLTQTQPVSPEERLFSPDGPENRAPLVTRRVSGDHTGSLSPEEPTHVTSTPRASLYGARVPRERRHLPYPCPPFSSFHFLIEPDSFARRIVARVINVLRDCARLESGVATGVSGNDSIETLDSKTKKKSRLVGFYDWLKVL